MPFSQSLVSRAGNRAVPCQYGVCLGLANNLLHQIPLSFRIHNISLIMFTECSITFNILPLFLNHRCRLRVRQVFNNTIKIWGALLLMLLAPMADGRSECVRLLSYHSVLWWMIEHHIWYSKSQHGGWGGACVCVFQLLDVFVKSIPVRD